MHATVPFHWQRWRRLVLVTLLVGATACQTATDCKRKVQSARRDAVRDADACRYEPEGLVQDQCSVGDDQPRNAWLAVWCGRATLTCIRSNAQAEAACFGGPDTGLLGSS